MEDSVRPQDPGYFVQVEDGVALDGVGEDGERLHERERVVLRRERRRLRLPVAGIKGLIGDVVVDEVEARCVRSEVPTAPLDHPTVEVDPQVALRTRALLDQLPGDSAAAATEVQHGLVGLGWKVGIDQIPGGVVERIRVGRARRARAFRGAGWEERPCAYQACCTPEVRAHTMPPPEEARAFLDRSSFIWHQRFELVPGLETPGVHDLAYLFDAGIHADASGRSVLDVGTSNGGAAFLLERAGAGSVVAVDVYPEDRFGFGEIRDFLGSNVEYLQGTVYDLTRLVGGRTFDLVLFWGVLYHLRHPLLALDEVRAVLREDGEISLETAVGDDVVGTASDLSVARFYPGAELAGDSSNWFSPTTACVLDWCRTSGLEPGQPQVWGEGPGKRMSVSCRAIPGPPPYTQASYEVPLRAEPVQPGTRPWGMG